MCAGLQTIRTSQGCTGTVPESYNLSRQFQLIRRESDTCNCLDLHPAECVDRSGLGRYSLTCFRLDFQAQELIFNDDRYDESM